MFQTKIKVKHNYKKIEVLSDKIIIYLKDGIEKVLKNIQNYAINLDEGHNSQGILIEIMDISTGKIKGRVYADPKLFNTEIENNQFMKEAVQKSRNENRKIIIEKINEMLKKL